MLELREAKKADREFWLSLDAHVVPSELAKKFKRHEAFVILADGQAIGILRFNLFWDEHPFLNLLFLEETARGQGYGRAAMALWETQMSEQHYKMVMTSTQSDETAQGFYRKLGYRDAGGLVLDDQATELFFVKSLEASLGEGK